MGNLIIYVDVDDTLVRSAGTKRVPMPSSIANVRALHSSGATLYLWSTGGAEYARNTAQELGIVDCFAGFLPKPTAIIDDQHIAEWRDLRHFLPTDDAVSRLSGTEIESLESIVEKADALTPFYGQWPNFHDAEVIELHLWRGYVHPGDWDDRNIFPVLTAKILILEATQAGADGNQKNVLVTFRFHDVDSLQLQDFNHDNSIVCIRVSKRARGHFTTGEPLPPSLSVTVEQGFGVRASFSCSRVEVVHAEWAQPGSVGQPRS